MTDIDNTPEAGFNPFDPAFAVDPYPVYAAMRESSPVLDTGVGPWVLFGYEDCKALLRDASTSVEDRNAADNGLRDEMFARVADELDGDFDRASRSILNLDPPDHTRVRKLMSRVFTPKRIEELRPTVQRLVDDALDTVDSRSDDSMELIGDLAFPLPFAVISEMLGMPEGDRDQIRDWSGAMVRTLDPVITDEQALDAMRSGRKMYEHLAEVIEWKRANPGDDLLSALIEAEVDGDMLSADELADQVTLLFIAGHETTVNLIGNGTLALLQHPAELSLLRDDPSLITNAVEECLRYDSPVQNSRRITMADAQIAGHAVPAGQFVLTALGSANRDPAHFGPTAGELDIERPDANEHISFGSGIHHCLGAALARLEGQAAIGTLVERFPGLRLAGDPVWNGRITLRGMERLPLSLS